MSKRSHYRLERLDLTKIDTDTLGEIRSHLLAQEDIVNPNMKEEEQYLFRTAYRVEGEPPDPGKLMPITLFFHTPDCVGQYVEDLDEALYDAAEVILHVVRRVRRRVDAELAIRGYPVEDLRADAEEATTRIHNMFYDGEEPDDGYQDDGEEPDDEY